MTVVVIILCVCYLQIFISGLDTSVMFAFG